MSEEKKYPEVIIGALIINENDKILLARSKKWGNRYAIPGGHIEQEEKLEEAVIREVKEETNLDIEIISPLRFSESVFSKEFHKEKHFILLSFLCKYEGDGSEIKMNEEFEEKFKWVSLEEAKKLDLTHGVKKIIEEYEEYRKNKECMDNWKRCQADFENYQKDQEKRMIEFRKFANADMITQIFPVLDNFEMSLAHIPESEKESPWVEGILHIKKQLEQVLKDNGVEEIEAKEGEEFDPAEHEAVKHDTNDANQDANSANMRIKSVARKGYKMDGKIIRAARVIVN